MESDRLNIQSVTGICSRVYRSKNPSSAHPGFPQTLARRPAQAYSIVYFRHPVFLCESRGWSHLFVQPFEVEFTASDDHVLK